MKSRLSKKLNSAIVSRTTTLLKKESKKRHVEFESVPKMKRIMISPAESTMEYDCQPQVMQAQASPPPTDDKRKKNSLWDYDDSGYFSPSTGEFVNEDLSLFQDTSIRSALFNNEFSYAANALDLVMSPPPSSSPMRFEKTGIFGPRTPAPPVKNPVTASPGTCLREHRQQMLQMLHSPEAETLTTVNEVEDDPWLTNTPKLRESSNSLLDSPWDEVAERAAFGSPEKRESRRRESRRSLVCGLHAQELYDGDTISSMPGVNVLDIMKREVDKMKGVSRFIRPSLMERSQSSLF